MLSFFPKNILFKIVKTAMWATPQTRPLQMGSIRFSSIVLFKSVSLESPTEEIESELPELLITN